MCVWAGLHGILAAGMQPMSACARTAVLHVSEWAAAKLAGLCITAMCAHTGATTQHTCPTAAATPCPPAHPVLPTRAY